MIWAGRSSLLPKYADNFNSTSTHSKRTFYIKDGLASDLVVADRIVSHSSSDPYYVWEVIMPK